MYLPQKKTAQRGFTFIELIASLLILSILATMSTYFIVDLAQLYIQKESKNELLEEARHTLRLLTKEIRSASSISDPPLPAVGNPPILRHRVQFNQVYPGADLTDVIYAYEVLPNQITRTSNTQATVPVGNNITAFNIWRDSYNVIEIEVTFDNGVIRPITLNTFVRPRAFSIY